MAGCHPSGRVPRSLPAGCSKPCGRMASRFAADTSFHGVIDGCAAPAAGREKTWINATIRKLYGELFQREAIAIPWRAGRTANWSAGSTVFRLAARSSARACSPMPRMPSKVALVHLVARLRAGGYRLLWTRSSSPIISPASAPSRFQRIYGQKLAAALATQGDFTPCPRSCPVPRHSVGCPAPSRSSRLEVAQGRAPLAGHGAERAKLDAPQIQPARLSRESGLRCLLPPAARPALALLPSSCWAWRAFPAREAECRRRR